MCARVKAAKAQRRSQLSGRFSLCVCQNRSRVESILSFIGAQTVVEGRPLYL